MSASDPPQARHRFRALDRQPALSAALHHRAVLGRQCHRRPARRRAYSAGDAVVPALVASPFCIILPFAWKHLVRDWAAIRGRLGIMVMLSVTGIGAFNTMQYWALEHTQALNTLLLQSAGPLFVAMWSLLLLGVRLTLAQAGGIAAVAGRRAGHPAAWRPDDAEEHRVQHAATSSSCAALVIFGLYSVLIAEAAAHPRPVLCRLHLRLRRGRA